MNDYEKWKSGEPAKKPNKNALIVGIIIVLLGLAMFASSFEWKSKEELIKEEQERQKALEATALKTSFQVINKDTWTSSQMAGKVPVTTRHYRVTGLLGDGRVFITEDKNIYDNTEKGGNYSVKITGERARNDGTLDGCIFAIETMR